jgi:hypothetical protein
LYVLAVREDVSWGNAVDALEAPGKMALFRKAGLIGHSGDGLSCKQELFCMLQTDLIEIGMGRQPHRLVEDTREMKGRDTCSARKLRQGNIVSKMRFQVLSRHNFACSCISHPWIIALRLFRSLLVSA